MILPPTTFRVSLPLHMVVETEMPTIVGEVGVLSTLYSMSMYLRKWKPWDTCRLAYGHVLNSAACFTLEGCWVRYLGGVDGDGFFQE